MSQVITWNKFYGGVSSDDKLTSGNQVLYSEGLDLTSQTDKVFLSHKPSTSVTTNGKLIYGFINAKRNLFSTKRTFGYGEDGVIYDVGGTNDTPDYTAPTAIDIINALNFNGNTYFMQAWGPGQSMSYAYITEDNLYNKTGSLTQVSLSSKISGAPSFYGSYTYKYPMYNWLDTYMYIGAGRSIYREDNAGVGVKFDLGTDDIVGITESGGVFKLYQRDGRIIFWNGLSSNADSIVNTNEIIRSVIQHGGVDYILGGEGAVYNSLYYLNGYRLEKIQSATDSKIPENPQDNRSNKFKFKGDYMRESMQFSDGQLLFINDDVGDSVYSFGKRSSVMPNSFSQVFYISPNGINQSIYSIGESTSGQGFYFGYSDTTHSGIGYYIESSSNYTSEGSMILPLFDGGLKTKKKKMKELRVYADCGSGKSIIIKAKINGDAFITIATITEEGRSVFYIDYDFYDLVIQADFASTYVFGNDYTYSTKLSEIQLIYDIIED